MFFRGTLLLQLHRHLLLCIILLIFPQMPVLYLIVQGIINEYQIYFPIGNTKNNPWFFFNYCSMDSIFKMPHGSLWVFLYFLKTYILLLLVGRWRFNWLRGIGFRVKTKVCGVYKASSHTAPPNESFRKTQPLICQLPFPSNLVMASLKTYFGYMR